MGHMSADAALAATAAATTPLAPRNGSGQIMIWASSTRASTARGERRRSIARSSLPANAATPT
jgi:hypothetical protein